MNINPKGSKFTIDVDLVEVDNIVHEYQSQGIKDKIRGKVFDNFNTNCFMSTYVYEDITMMP